MSKKGAFAVLKGVTISKVVHFMTSTVHLVDADGLHYYELAINDGLEAGSELGPHYTLTCKKHKIVKQGQQITKQGLQKAKSEKPQKSEWPFPPPNTHNEDKTLD
jgi:hypothetical protein